MKIRTAAMTDYEAVETIMQQVHALHLAWRPDIYRAAETIYEKAYFEKLLAENRILVAEAENS